MDSPVWCQPLVLQGLFSFLSIGGVPCRCVRENHNGSFDFTDQPRRGNTVEKLCQKQSKKDWGRFWQRELFCSQKDLVNFLFGKKHRIVLSTKHLRHGYLMLMIYLLLNCWQVASIEGFSPIGAATRDPADPSKARELCLSIMGGFLSHGGTPSHHPF